MLNYDSTAVMDEMNGKAWREFLRVPSLSVGVYRLKVGEVDRQSPHTEDEVYFVIEGRAKFVAGEETMDVKKGTTLFVERLLPHRFFNVTEDLTVLVFFAPAENSQKGSRLSHINVTMPKGKEDEAGLFMAGCWV